MKRHLAAADAVVSCAQRRATIQQVQGARRSGGRTVGGCLVAGVLAGALTGSLLLAPTASAASVDTRGKVVDVKDGETVVARIDGKKHTFRITGLNAMELTDYGPGHLEGQCHAVEATRLLEKLVLKKRVRITARHESSKSGKEDRGKPDRLRRSLAVKDAHGTTIDPAAELIRQGLALWMPNEDEYLPNSTRGDALSYSALAAEAAADRRGLWNTDSCGVGPSQNATLRVSVDPGAETVSITNQGTNPVSLARWRVRDSSYHGKLAKGYKFPRGTVVPAGGTIVLHTGKGDNRGGHYYWNLNKPVFDNVTDAPTFMADGAYLFDPQGDLRAAHQYAPQAPIQFP